MGSPKALLPDPDGRPFVVRLATTFLDAEIPDVIVVAGARHDEIRAALAHDPRTAAVRVVRNEDPSRGQLSSLWTALDALATAPPDAVLMTPVDVPMVQPDTVQRLVRTWRQTSAPIVRPSIGGTHGHPVLFDRTVLRELREASLTEGAKAVVRRYEQRLVNLEVTDRGAMQDVDTPADYQQLIQQRHDL